MQDATNASLSCAGWTSAGSRAGASANNLGKMELRTCSSTDSLACYEQGLSGILLLLLILFGADRATARTMLEERLGIRTDLIEHQLSHRVRDATGRAYNRTQFLTQRAAMMQTWADYLFQLKDGYAEVDEKVSIFRKEG